MVGGWTVASRYGLRQILTNAHYIGHLQFDGKIVKRNAHPAIVDADNFAYAMEHLATTDLNGNTIERQPRTVRYSQKGYVNEALLFGCRQDGKPVIDGVNGQHVYSQLVGHPSYLVYLIKDRTKPTTSAYEASILASKLDGIIEERIIHLLRISQQHSDSKKALGQSTAVRSPRHTAIAIENTPAPTNKTVDMALKEARAAHTAVTRRINVAGDVMSDGDLRAAYEKQSNLARRIVELEATIEHASRIQRVREQGSRDIKRAHYMYAHWSLDERRQFIAIATDAITLQRLPDGQLQLTITWSHLMGLSEPIDTATITRVRNKQPEVTWQSTTSNDTVSDATEHAQLNTF